MGGVVDTAGDIVGDVVSGVGDVVQDVVIDPVKDVASDLDDFVNEEIPGGWYTVAALAGGAYYGAEAIAAGNAAEAGALASGATAAEAAAAGTAAADAAMAAAGGAFDMGGVGNALGGYWGAGSAAAPIVDAAVADYIGGTGAYDAGVGLDALTGGPGLSSVVGGTAVGVAPEITFTQGVSSLADAVGETLLGGVGKNPLQAMQLAGGLAKPTQPTANPYAQMQAGQTAPQSVDYASLLSLLQAKQQAGGLLGTKFQPQPINLSSLLG